MDSLHNDPLRHQQLQEKSEVQVCGTYRGSGRGIQHANVELYPGYDFREGDFVCNQQMPPHLQAVLNLIAFDGYSYEEVSQALEISQVTVRTRLCRAKKWLNDYIYSER